MARTDLLDISDDLCCVQCGVSYEKKMLAISGGRKLWCYPCWKSYIKKS